MKKFRLLLYFFALVFINGNAQTNYPLPTASQLLWSESELGVLISYDLPIFQGKPYNQAANRITPIPDYNSFNPTKLNTDQWIESVKSMGGKFAVLTVTHETGFAIYQSDVNPYCMKALKFQDGKGDIVRDFVASCRKYGILPGLYVGIRWNSFFGVHDFRIEGTSDLVKNRQIYYKKMCEGMVKELCTRYGNLFMIWFDGGADDPTKYGADVLPIVAKYQPNCLFYHNSQRADFRWGGSESGTVPYPCWSTFPFPFSHSDKKDIVFANDFYLLKHGDKDGKYWMPAMSDAPLRGYDGGHDWLWNPNEDNHVFPLEHMMKMYKNSVGHNSTLIVGLTPDNTGLIPAADVNRLKEWGDEIKKEFSNPVFQTKAEGNKININLPAEKQIKRILLQEDIAKGERVRKFWVEAKVKGKWQKIVEGTCIGNKFIHEFEPVNCKKLRIIISEAIDKPLLKNIEIY